MNALFLKSTLVLILLSCGFVGLYGQNTSSEKETKKQQREEKKLAAKAQEEAQWLQYQELARNKNFVVEITQIGDNNSFSGRLNFLYVHNDSVTFQVPTYGPFSTNGLGGMTINGWITNYKYTPPAKSNKPIVIEFDIQAKNRSGFLNVDLTVYGDGTAVVSMGVDFSGNFMNPASSQIIRGADMRD